MNKKGLSVLEALIAKYGPEIIESVITAEDTAVICDYHDDIRRICMGNHVLCWDRKLEPGIDRQIAYGLAVGWRWLIKSEIRLIVFHDSLLPKYRGFAPLVSALLNREPRLGVSALFATDRFDEGDLIGQESISVSYPLAQQTAIDLITDCYAALACRIAESVKAGIALSHQPQEHSQATYSPWRDEDDYRIDWTSPSADIHQFVLSVGFPYQGASAVVNGLKVRVLATEPISGYIMARPAVGKVLFIEGGQPHIVTGSGLIRIKKLVDSITRESLLPWKLLRSRFT